MRSQWRKRSETRKEEWCDMCGDFHTVRCPTDAEIAERSEEARELFKSQRTKAFEPKPLPVEIVHVSHQDITGGRVVRMNFHR